MFKIANAMFLYTETSFHCGSGTSLGVIDLPIQRERYTEYPILQASGVKGAIRDWFETKDKGDGNTNSEKIKIVFGPDFSREDTDAFAAAATFTDGRVLLFPVRSLKGVYAYTTSRLALNRFKRDLDMVNNISIEWSIPHDIGEKAIGIEGSNLQEGDKCILEEYVFDFQKDDEVKKIAEWLSCNALPKGDEYEFYRNKLKKDLVILHDDIFRDFMKLSTEVQARIRIDDDKKTAAEHALFYEEAMPPDSLIYSIVMAQGPLISKRPDGMQDANDVMAFIQGLHGKRAQFGGDATIGRGIISLSFLNKGGDK